MGTVKDALSEDSKTSSVRVVMLAAFALFFPAFVTVWTKISWFENSLQDVPAGVLWLIGILLAGKVSQKFIEKKGGIR